MATSKAKRGRKPAAKSGSKSSKPSTTAKAEKVEKKAVVSVEKTDAKTKTKTVKETPVVITSKAEEASSNSKFFGRKFDANENILTIFKDTKIVGAILAEIVGVMLITMIVLTLGLIFRAQISTQLSQPVCLRRAA